jgi:hypothetical protein
VTNFISLWEPPAGPDPPWSSGRVLATLHSIAPACDAPEVAGRVGPTGSQPIWASAAAAFVSINDEGATPG